MILWRKTLCKKYVVDLGETLQEILFSQNRTRFKTFNSKSDMLQYVALKSDAF